MTPEERAEEIVKQYDVWDDRYGSPGARLTDLITQALQHERETIDILMKALEAIKTEETIGDCVWIAKQALKAGRERL